MQGRLGRFLTGKDAIVVATSPAKGQIKLKADWRAINSPKKEPTKLFFLPWQSGNTWNLKSSFQVSNILGESMSRQSAYVFFFLLLERRKPSQKGTQPIYVLSYLACWHGGVASLAYACSSEGNTQQKIVLQRTSQLLLTISPIYLVTIAFEATYSMKL